MKKYQYWINVSLHVIAIYLVIGLFWRGLEMIFYGKILPSYVDDVIAIIFAISIYINILHHYDVLD